MKEPARLKDLLNRVGGRIGVQDTRATGLVWARWREIVGEAVASNAEPTSLRDGVLRVRAVSPTWATELTYLGSEIKARANELAGASVVREVRVWTGPGPVTGATSQRPAGGSDGPPNVAPEEESGDLETAFRRARAAWGRRLSNGR